MAPLLEVLGDRADPGDRRGAARVVADPLGVGSAALLLEAPGGLLTTADPPSVPRAPSPPKGANRDRLISFVDVSTPRD